MSTAALMRVRDAEKSEERRGNLCDRYGAGFKQSVVETYLKFMLCLSRVDPFSIYKRQDERSSESKNRYYLSPGLRMGPNYFDRLWNRISAPVSLLMYYMLIKYTIIGMLQVFSCILVRRRNSSLRGVESGSNTTFPLELLRAPFLTKRTAELHNQTAIEVLDGLGTLIDGSLWSITSVSFLVQATMAFTLFYLYVVNPQHFEQSSMDSASIRFILDPVREIRRVDLVIKHELEKILIESSNNRLVFAYLSRLKTMRPSTYSSEWHLRGSHYLFSTIVFMVPGIVMIEMFACYLFYRETQNARCKFGQPNQCGFYDIFTLQDSLRLFEVLCGRLACSSNINLIFMIISSDLTYLHSMVTGVKRDLNECLSNISLAITRMRSSPSFSYNRARMTIFSVGDRRVSDTIRYSFGTEDNSELCSIEASLLVTYIKLMVTQGEIGRTAHFVSKLAETVLVVVAIALGGIAITVLVDSPGDDLIRLIWLVLSWNAVNPVLVGCALVYSHAIDTEKTAWSILAELRSYQDIALQTSQLRSYSSRGGLMEVLAIRWRKLVESFSLSDKRNSVSAFGMSLTYGQVLRMNFFVLSVASLKQLI